MKFNGFRIAPYFAPDAGDGSGGPGTSDQKAGGDGKPPETVTMTQAQLDALFADRARRAEESSTAKFLEKFGVKSPDEIKAKLETLSKIEAANQSEAEKTAAKVKQLEETAAQALKEKEEALAVATEKLKRAAVLQQATERGFRPEAVADVWLVIDRTTIKEDGENFSGVKEAVEAVAKSKPFWLEDKKGGQPPRGTPPPKNGKEQTPPDKNAQQLTPSLRL